MGRAPPSSWNPNTTSFVDMSRREVLARKVTPRGLHRHEGAEVSRSAWMWERRVPAGGLASRQDPRVLSRVWRAGSGPKGVPWGCHWESE